MRCPICKKKRANREQLVDHIEKAHGNQIPENMNGYQYLYFLNHGRAHGICIVDGAPTPWNEKTQKPYRNCRKPVCREKLRNEALTNMDNYYGEGNHPVTDPEHQKKMQRNKKKNLIYKFADGTEFICLSKDEFALMRYLEKFLNLGSDEAIECPYVFEYDDNGVKRKYLPDVFLMNYGVIIEQKDANNTNPKFLEETRYKVKLKAEAVEKDGRFHYIIVYGNNYGPLVKLLYDIRMDSIKGRKDKKYYIHNEAVTDIPYEIVEHPPLYIGVVKKMGLFMNLFITDDPKCNSLYIGDEDYNLSKTSIQNKYFLDKEIDLYQFNGEIGDREKIMTNSWLSFIFHGDRTIELISTPPIEWVLDNMYASGIFFYVDNIVNNNIQGKSDFSLVLSKNFIKEEIQ